MAYFHTPVPMSVEDFRKVIYLPFLMTSPLALLLVVLAPTFPMAVLAAMIVGGCMGELMMDQQIRRFRGRGLYVIDHPTQCGFDVGRYREKVSDSSFPAAASSANHGSVER